MNLALPALVLLYLALPGFLLVKASRGRLAQGANEPVVNLSAMTVGFVISLLLAPALHLLWIFLAERVTDYTIDLATVGFLLAGAYQETSQLNEAIVAATHHPVAVLSYFVTLCMFSVVVGRWLHTLVIKYKLDRKVSWLRFNNEWHYLFSAPEGEDGDEAKYEHGTRVAVTVRQGDKVYIYTGLLDSYSLTADGKLDHIALIEPVYRRDLARDPPDGEEYADRDSSGRFYKIPGDRFVVWTKDIATLNVDYLYLIPTEGDEGDDQDDGGRGGGGPAAAVAADRPTHPHPPPSAPPGHLPPRRRRDDPLDGSDDTGGRA